MQVLKLIRPYDLPVINVIGEQIDSGGSDGEIFALADQPDKVIKLSVIFDRFDQTPKNIYQKNILPTFDYVMIKSPPAYVHVYEHGYLGEYNRKMLYWKDGLQNFVIHYCIMEKLLKLTEDEKKVFHSVISHEDRGIKKDLFPEKVSKILDGLSRGLDFDVEMVKLFFEQLQQIKIEHNDLHQRNVMKTNNGYFKLIDLDRCQYKIGE